MQAQRQRLLAVLQLADRVLQHRLRPCRLTLGAPPPHAGDVASGTERRPGAGEHDAADARVGLQGEQDLPQRGRQLVREGIALLGTVQRDGGHAPLEAAEELVGTRVEALGRHRD
jgi:hypothetical protein